MANAAKWESLARCQHASSDGGEVGRLVHVLLGKWRAIYSFGGQISDTPLTELSLPKGESLIGYFMQ